MFSLNKDCWNDNFSFTIKSYITHRTLASSIIPHIPTPHDAASPIAEPHCRAPHALAPASSLPGMRLAFPRTLHSEPNHASHAVQHTHTHAHTHRAHACKQ
ncbi:Zn(II)2Cys6 transcription factor [Alternaria sp. MG1]|nr:Zn(II)2Cys6 transcription factor [Alternaria sp. MG1]